VVANRLWIIGTVVLIALMLLGTYLLAVAPLIATAGANAAETASVQAQNAAHEQTLKDLKEKFAHIDELRKQLKEVQEAVPPTAAQSPLIDEIGDLAAANGVVVEVISFSDPEAYVPGDSTDPEVQAAAAGLGSGNFLVIPVELTVVGPSNAALDFLRDLQHGKRLFLAYSATFEGASDDSSSGIGRITISGQIFVLTSFAGGADPAPVTEDPAT
jgi:hypothetical protein